ncbi:putative F-box protein At1g49610 [Trifolium pratense]|uniref:putative F-box protein At1g49610 n=1 Tax=Trifolium pratense TaxID=57577 RepID=UPI001E694E62|nr:putative F-box protein At1g49610 [Trifolium pratense]
MDRISELPDEILSYILTMLSIKDLLKTSILSKRWRKLWYLRRDLDFNILHMLGSTSRKPLEERGHLNINMDEFVKRVDQFLNNFQGTKIDSFSLSFYSNDKHSNIIDQWISFAIARGVETINLLLLTYNRYKFAFDLFSETNTSTLKHLRLERCLVCHPTKCDYIPFKNLRSLSLYFSKVDEIFIESLLTNCRWLEELDLEFCEFRSSMPKIVSSSLSNLKVRKCYVVSGNMKKEIDLSSLDCLKLTSLEYHGYNLDTLNINTPLLNIIYCTVPDCEDPIPKQYALFATLPKLEIMKLDFYSRVPILKITQPFKHLKQLDITFYIEEYSEFDLLGILTLLQASPLLHKLSIMLTHPEIVGNQNVVKDVDICSHDEVRVIELRGCVGNWYEIEFVMNVLRYAHKLERIVLSPYWRECDSWDWKSDPVWFQNGRQRISEKLLNENVVGREKLVLI